MAFTADRYPVQRKDFSELTEQDVQKFTSILDSHRVVTGQSEMEGIMIDSYNKQVFSNFFCFKATMWTGSELSEARAI